MFTVKPGDRICIVGDSITEDVNVGGWYRPFMDNIRAYYHASPYATYPAGAGGVTLTPTFVTHPPPTLSGAGTGISGGQTADIIAAWSTLVTAFEPFDTIIIQLGINDWRHQPGTTQAATIANVNTLCSAAYGGKYRDLLWCGPCCGDLSVGEDWSSFGNAAQTNLDALNTAMSAAVIANGYTYVDWRTPFKALEQSSGFNPSHLGQGIFTVDGVHPGPANGQPLPNLGQRYLSSWTLPSVAIT